MSDSTVSTQKSRQSPIAGVVPILIALLLTAVYFKVPHITSKWSVPGDMFFRGLVVLIGLTGVIKLFGAMSKSRPQLPWLLITQHRMSIPLEGWIYLGIIIVLFTGAMLTKQNTLLLVFALMAGPFVINGWMTFGMLQAASLQREIPRRAMQGELFSAELQLRNVRPLFAIWMMSVRDEILHARESLVGTVLFSRVSPRSSQSGQYQVRLAHRGRYRFGPLKCASRFPLGLVERSRIVFHDDFNQLREFRSGDNPRAIHWRSTARRGELILREFQQNRDHTLAVVLDLFQPSFLTSGFRDQVDLTLSFVASLLTERGRECRDGYLTLAAAGAETFLWEGQGNASSLESLFDGLAVMESGPAANITETLKETIQKSPATAQILVVTNRFATAPYQSLLTSRVDVLDLSDIAWDQLLTFDDDVPSIGA